MTVEKLKSGSYRIRQAYNGVRYSVTVPYKPTKKECLKLMAAEMDKAVVPKQRMTFETAAKSYIEAKSNVISPSTIKGYNSVLRIITDGFKQKIVTDITSVDVQTEVNAYSKDHSPKTVRNMHGFISAVMSMYAPNTILNTTLPMYVKKEPYIPTDDDIKAVIKEAHNTEYEVMLILAAYGLRRSEICALTMDDISDGRITINKALVNDDDGNWIVKSTKTASSTREVIVPKKVTDLIKKQGYIYRLNPNSVRDFLDRTQDKLGLPHFSIHKFRHYFASISHSLGVPDVYIMAAGGWKTDNVLKTVYRHAMSDKNNEMQKISCEHIENVIF